MDSLKNDDAVEYFPFQLIFDVKLTTISSNEIQLYIHVEALFQWIYERPVHFIQFVPLNPA